MTPLINLGVFSGELESFNLESTAFSQDGSKIASRYEGSNFITIGEINFTSQSYRPILDVDLDNISGSEVINFNALDNEKILVSNNGQYLLLSNPTQKKIYFIDTSSNSLLQTIESDDDGFGSIIAGDSDLKTFVAGSNSLRGSTSEYDSRSLSYSKCSRFHIYRRNFTSNSTQRFRKIHCTPASGGIESDPLIQSIAVGIDSLNTTPGVFRCSDIKCRNTDYATSTCGLIQDQINYKTRIFETSSPRYSISGFDTNFHVSAVTRSIGNVGVTAGYTFGAFGNWINTETETIPTKIHTNFYMKNFRILNNDRDSGEYIGLNGIYHSSAQTKEIVSRTGYFVEKLETLNDLPDWQPQLAPINEEIVATKISLNSNYNITTAIANSQGSSNFFRNIRIYRHPIRGYEEDTPFEYFDKTLSSSGISPDYKTSGVIKFIYPDNVSDSDLISVFGSGWTADPVNVSGVTFSISLNESGVSSENYDTFSSDEWYFLTNDNKTLIFNFDTSLPSIGIYEPLVFKQVKDYSLLNYSFFFDENGEYFTKDKKIYKFNRSTFDLDSIIDLKAYREI